MKLSESLDIVYGEVEGTARIPIPSHRHAAPSMPWPWIDVSDDVDPMQLKSELPLVPPLCDHVNCGKMCWRNYPQSRFPSWTRSQMKKSKILQEIEDYNRDQACKLLFVDLGRFTIPEEMEVSEQNLVESWSSLNDVACRLSPSILNLTITACCTPAPI